MYLVFQFLHQQMKDLIIPADLGQRLPDENRIFSFRPVANTADPACGPAPGNPPDYPENMFKKEVCFIRVDLKNGFTQFFECLNPEGIHAMQETLRRIMTVYACNYNISSGFLPLPRFFKANSNPDKRGILEGGENPFNYKRKHLCGLVLHYEKTYYILRSS